MTEEELPDRRRHGYKELEAQLTADAQANKNRLDEFIRKAMLGFLILGGSCALTLLGFGYLLYEQGRTTDKIQAQRKEFVRRSCDDQNKRHNGTIQVLDGVTAIAVEHDPTHEAQITEQRAQTGLFIDSIAPVQNCDDLVKSATATPPKER